MPGRIGSKGRVAIPADIREGVRAGAGTALERSYDPLGQRTIATKAVARPRRLRSRVAALRGSTGNRMSAGEIMALTRDPL